MPLSCWGGHSNRAEASSLPAPSFLLPESDNPACIYTTALSPIIGALAPYSPGNSYNKNCPKSVLHAAIGVFCGDVGFLTEHGQFVSAYNVTMPQEHPINYQGVPRNFEPFMANNNTPPVQRQCFYQQDTRFVAFRAPRAHTWLKRALKLSPPITAAFPSADGTYICGSVKSTGAFLHLPDGGTRFTTEPGLFKDFVRDYAESWLQYITEELDNKPVGNSIILVTECDKAKRWTLGTISQQLRNRTSYLRISPNEDEIACVGAAGRCETTYEYHSNGWWIRESPSNMFTANERQQASQYVPKSGFPLDKNLELPDSYGGRDCVRLQGIWMTLRSTPPSRGEKVNAKVASLLGSKPPSQKSKSDDPMSSTHHLQLTSATRSLTEYKDRPLPIEWNQRLLKMFPDARIAITNDIEATKLSSIGGKWPKWMRQYYDVARCENGIAFWELPNEPNEIQENDDLQNGDRTSTPNSFLCKTTSVQVVENVDH